MRAVTGGIRVNLGSRNIEIRRKRDTKKTFRNIIFCRYGSPRRLVIVPYDYYNCDRNTIRYFNFTRSRDAEEKKKPDLSPGVRSLLLIVSVIPTMALRGLWRIQLYRFTRQKPDQLPPSRVFNSVLLILFSTLISGNPRTYNL